MFCVVPARGTHMFSVSYRSLLRGLVALIQTVRFGEARATCARSASNNLGPRAL